MATLVVYEGEPLARLAAQQLEHEGIACTVRPVGVGPGGWGVAANLPYALDVLDEDAERAREVLDLLPRDPDATGERPISRRSSIILVVMVVLAAVLVMSVADALFERVFP